jgi:hypothetical protein
MTLTLWTLGIDRIDADNGISPSGLLFSGSLRIIPLKLTDIP